MATTLEALEQRVTDLEKRMNDFQQRNGQDSLEPKDNDIPLYRAARAQQTAVSKAAEEAYRKMGITVMDITHEEMRRLLAEHPLPPEEEWASREIMREREE